MKISKIIITILVFAASHIIHAKTILLCLGQEETYYAKKSYTGPNYKLNQMMIEEMTSLSDVNLTAPAYKRICSSPTQTPSLLLLEALLYEKQNIFKSVTGRNAAFQKVTLDTLAENSVDLLISYLSYIQATAPGPKCVEKIIPEVNIIYSRLRYLPDVIEKNEYIENAKEVRAIFSKLKRIDSLMKSCKKPKPRTK